MWYVIREDELYHHGIKGQKWGIRRFQNPNGTLTQAGKQRYLEVDKNDSATTKRVKNDFNKLSDKEFSRKYKVSKEGYEKRVSKYGDPFRNSPWAARGKKQLNGLPVTNSVKAGGLDAYRTALGIISGAIMTGVTVHNAKEILTDPFIQHQVQSFIKQVKNAPAYRAAEKYEAFNRKYGEPVWTDQSYITDLTRV